MTELRGKGKGGTVFAVFAALALGSFAVWLLTGERFSDSSGDGADSRPAKEDPASSEILSDESTRGDRAEPTKEADTPPGEGDGAPAVAGDEFFRRVGRNAKIAADKAEVAASELERLQAEAAALDTSRNQRAVDAGESPQGDGGTPWSSESSEDAAMAKSRKDDR